MADSIDGLLGVCVYFCRTYYKAVRGGGRRRVDDMCYDRRRAEACVDESARHAGTREEPGTFTQGAPVFPGCPRELSKQLLTLVEKTQIFYRKRICSFFGF